MYIPSGKFSQISGIRIGLEEGFLDNAPLDLAGGILTSILFGASCSNEKAHHLSHAQGNIF